MNAEVQDLSDKYDRISSMPDSILIHILTFLKAQAAVQTCLLSKRWIYLWAYLPSLNFDSEEFENDMFFERFVSSFLFLRKTSQLDTFQLRWSHENKYVNTKCVTSWVVYAVRCKPHVLCIYAPSFYYKLFPHSLFSCAPLEELKLFLYTGKDIREFVDSIMSTSINLPFLRKLSLALVNINIEKLLLGCPLLEGLELQGCSLVKIKISSPSLKYLTVVDCFCGDTIISCPNLINLHLADKGFFEITLENLFSLENAFLHIPYGYLDGIEILSGLSNASEIKLFGRAFKIMLAEELPNCSTLKNLRHLVLDERLKSMDLDIMAYFLRCSPNLDKFYFSDLKEENIVEEESDSTDSEDGDAYGYEDY